MSGIPAVIPVSALKGDAVTALLTEIVKNLPEGEPIFAEDELTDQPMRMIVAELDVVKPDHAMPKLQELRESFARLIGAEGALTGAMGRLFAVMEAYPDLKANQNFLALQEELTATEGRVAYARQFYNDSVLGYHNKIDTFPGVLVAKMGSFPHREFFDAPEGDEATEQWLADMAANDVQKVRPRLTGGDLAVLDTLKGYTEAQIQDILDYMLGHATLEGAPFANDVTVDNLIRRFAYPAGALAALQGIRIAGDMP